MTNGGAVATENLAITDVVQTKTGSGQFADYVSATVDLSAKPVLAPMESYCYPYRIEFAPVSGALYRNVANITITNHSGSLGTPFGPSPKADFTIPTTPEILEHDGTATLTDALTCVDGFTCSSPSPAITSPIDDSVAQTYDVTVTRTTAACATEFTFNNTATLTPVDSKTPITANGSIKLMTAECATGCTLTLGFYKTHAGFTGNNPDLVTQRLPISLGTSGGAKTVVVTTATQAVTILSFSGDASNGINRLYAQLLAAKLNQANGADMSKISSTIAAADAFLATHDAADWSTLSKSDQNNVNKWQSALDNFNNGLLGPPHCI